MVKRLSLKARALTWLAQREHSRAELRRKLMRLVQIAERGIPEPASPEPATPEGGTTESGTSDHAASQGRLTEARGTRSRTRSPFGTDKCRVRPAPVQGHQVATPHVAVPTTASYDDSAHCVESLLDWLEAHGYLSDSRFIESRVHVRAGRFGNLRIRQELEQHGVELDEQTLKQLRDSELERAREVWTRKFGAPPVDAAARARQLRFLAQRGFSIDVALRIVRDAEDDFG